jgi:hypothetical protein
MTQAGLPLSTKTNAREHGLDWTGARPGEILAVLPEAQANAKKSAAPTTAPGRIAPKAPLFAPRCLGRRCSDEKAALPGLPGKSNNVQISCDELMLSSLP